MEASAIEVGAVLSQTQEEEERFIAYYSKTFAPPKRNYCVAGGSKSCKTLSAIFVRYQIQTSY